VSLYRKKYTATYQIININRILIKYWNGLNLNKKFKKVLPQNIYFEN